LYPILSLQIVRSEVYSQTRTYIVCASQDTYILFGHWVRINWTTGPAMSMYTLLIILPNPLFIIHVPKREMSIIECYFLSHHALINPA
jgi:hypothetical protein